MKAILGIVAIALAIAVLCSGGVALAGQTFTCDCSGLCTGAWTWPTSWDVGEGYPQDVTDNVTLDDPDSGSICTYNPSTALVINEMTLAGVSPTKMTLHVRDQALDVDELDFEDYGQIDADKDFTADGPTSVSGDVWIDVADSTTVILDHMTVVTTGAQVHLTTGTNSTCDINFLTIASVVGGIPTSNRTFKLLGGELDVTNDVILTSNLTVGASEWAKLWVASGSMTITRRLDINGGDSTTSAARIDVDGTLTSTTVTEMNGRVNVDVASGKTFDTGRLEVGTGAILIKTGPGTLQSS